MATTGDTVLYRIRPVPNDIEAWRPAIVLRVVDVPTEKLDLGVFLTTEDRRQMRCGGARPMRPDPRFDPGPCVVTNILPGTEPGQWKVKV